MAKCVIEQTAKRRGGLYDAITEAMLERIWAPKMAGYHQRLLVEGYFAEVTLFGVKRVYRVASGGWWRLLPAVQCSTLKWLEGSTERL